MAVRAPGDYDPNTGWPPDNSTGIQWQNDVALPGQFGPGGFRASPKLTAPASGPPPGMSLPTPTNGAGMSPHIDPTTGQPEMLTGPGGAGGFNPFSLLGAIPNPYWKGAIAGAGVLAPTPAETGEFNPAMITGRPDAPMGTTHGLPATPMSRPGGIGSDANAPVMGAGGFPTTYAAPGQQPAQLGPTAPDATGDIKLRAPAVPVPRPRAAPRAAGPAAVKQQPNLGSYFGTFDRPNANPDIGGGMLGGGSAGGRGGPVGNRTMGMLDLSKLFSRQQ